MTKNIIKVDWKYDPVADALSIDQKEKYDYEESVSLTENIILDFDMERKFVGVEILDASKVFKIPKNKSAVKNITGLKMYVKISEKSIELNIDLTVLIHKKSLVKTIDTLADNDLNLPSITAELAVA